MSVTVMAHAKHLSWVFVFHPIWTTLSFAYKRPFPVHPRVCPLPLHIPLHIPLQIPLQIPLHIPLRFLITFVCNLLARQSMTCVL
ncbi:hypothetical protein B0T09DRAFT_139903 [Sordaria sp. MPI-SDFR-AT-0083]|nr:hypothetical protein B0T09DRAFT_139903 [Sordaria sp. MPI-SDFR-AT-0083]